MMLTDRSEPSEPSRIERLKALGPRISIYAAKEDRALQSAEEFDKFKRAGAVGDDDIPVFVSDEAQTLDATAVKGGWVGHSYIYTSKSVIDDLQTIIAEHAQPAEPPRVWLERRGQGPDYWAFN
jgi:esterase/lipase superfamily enzyme